jgi:hypothetical protein
MTFTAPLIADIQDPQNAVQLQHVWNQKTKPQGSLGVLSSYNRSSSYLPVTMAWRRKACPPTPAT